MAMPTDALRWGGYASQREGAKRHGSEPPL